MLRNLDPQYKYTVVPYSILAIVYNLVVNPMHSLVSSPVRCNRGACDSYLLTGGLVMTTPWPPTNLTQYPVVEVYNAPATQIDFERGLDQGDAFSNATDCSVFGAEGFLIGIKLCVAWSRVAPDSLIAGESFGSVSKTPKELWSATQTCRAPGLWFFEQPRFKSLNRIGLQ
jgi:hypothetical protein